MVAIHVKLSKESKPHVDKCGRIKYGSAQILSLSHFGVQPGTANGISFKLEIEFPQPQENDTVHTSEGLRIREHMANMIIPIVPTQYWLNINLLKFSSSLSFTLFFVPILIKDQVDYIVASY